ncbi:hypothetical protein E2I00_009907, partial [Balaenoptera physalus]
ERSRAALKACYRGNRYPTPDEKRRLATLTGLSLTQPSPESDGNPTTEDESSRSPEDLERGAAPVAAEAPAQGSIFLAGAAPPAPCPASSSILVNGSFLAAGSSPAVLLNGSPAQPEAPETKGAQVAASGPPGEEVPGPLPQVVPGPPPAATFPLPPGPVTSVAAPQVVPLSPPPGYPAGLGPTSPLLNLPQVVPTSQVVTLPQAVGPLQLLAAGPGSPVKVAAAPGPANVHLINSGVGVTALQLPSATAPGTPFWWLGGGYSYLREGWRCQWASWGNGNFLLANPVSGSPIVTGVAVQQGKIILTATFPTSMLAHALGALSAQPPPAPAAASLPFSPDSSGLLPGFQAPPPEGLLLSPAAVPIWPAGLELSAGTEGLLEAEKGLGTQAPHTVLRLPDPDPEGLLLGATAGGEVDEGLEAETKVLTQLQSVPVEEPLEL